MPHERKCKAIEINAALVYTQVTLCWQDPSVSASVPILREAAGVSWDILNSVKIVKANKNALHRLAYHAADLIVVIWRSYNRTKVPKHWLSPQLQYILQELLQNLNSILEFVNKKVSMNAILRLIRTDNDVDTIQRYHNQLKQAIAKFEVQSHINTCSILAQILKKQEHISNQIQRRNDARDIVSRSNVNHYQTKPKRPTYSIDVEEGTTATRSLEAAAALPVERMASSERPKITKNAEETTRESACRWTENPDLQFEGYSEDENQSDEQQDDNEVSPAINSSRTNLNRCSSPKPTPSLSTTHTQPCRAHENHGTFPYPSFSFTNSDGGVIVNQGIGNITHTNISNVGNDRSENYHYYY